MDWALKFVKPEGLSHPVEGGTNGTRHGSIAICRRLSGVKPSVPKGGGETREDFCPFASSESEEKRVESDPNSFEESFVAAPAAAALGAG